MKIPTSISIHPQFAVNMFFEKCSHSHKPIRIFSLHGNMLTYAVGGLKEGIVLNDLGTPWGGRQTVRRSEQVICSALLHVKWDTFTLSSNFCPSSQPHFLFSPKGKLHKGSEKSEVFLWRGFLSYTTLLYVFTSLFFLHIQFSFSTFSFLFDPLSLKHTWAIFVSQIKHLFSILFLFFLFSVLSYSLFPSLLYSRCFGIYDAVLWNCNVDI